MKKIFVKSTEIYMHKNIFLDNKWNVIQALYCIIVSGVSIGITVLQCILLYMFGVSRKMKLF